MAHQKASMLLSPPSLALDAGVVTLSGVFVFFLVFLYPSTPILIEADHHIFLYEGMRLLEGDVMYRDFFQFTFPGSQAYYWLMLALFGANYYVLGVTIVAIAVASAVVCLGVSRMVLPSSMHVLPVLIFIFFGFRWLGLDGAHRMFSPIFVMLAIWLVLTRTGTIGLALAGASCALASFFTQQRGFIAIIAISVFLLIDGAMKRDAWASVAGRMALLTASFVLVLACLCSYFVFQAGWEAFYQSTFVYPAKYYGYYHQNNFSVLGYDLGIAFNNFSPSKIFYVGSVLFYLFLTPLAYVVFWALFLRERQRENWHVWRGITLVAMVGTLLVGFNLNTPSSGRLFQVSLPGLVVLVWLLHYTRERIAPSLKYIAPMFAGFLIFVGLIQAVRVQSAEYGIIVTPSGTLAHYPGAIIDNRYRWLAERTQPGDYVFEVYVPYIYFPMHLKNPTAYAQIWDSDYTRPEHVARTIEQLGQDPPRYILWDNNYNKSAEQRAPGDHLEPLYQFLIANYRPTEAQVDNGDRYIQIWEPK